MVRRSSSSSRFRPQEPTISNAASAEEEQYSNNHHQNDTASDLGSDIMTVSDIHTITNENEIAMMQQQHYKSLNKQNLDLLTPTPYGTNSADAAGGISNYHLYSPSDIRTIDNDNASIISDLQHTVGTAGGGGGHDDIHTVTGTVTGSVLHLSSQNADTRGNNNTGNNMGSTVILGVDPNDRMKSTIEPEITSSSDHNLNNSSFWARAMRTIGMTPVVPNVTTQTTTEYDEYYDEGRPLAFLNATTPMNHNVMDPTQQRNGDEHGLTPLPPAVIVTTRNRNHPNDIDTYGQGANGDDTFSNAMMTPTTSVWKQRLCGLRADRLILLLMFVLLAAVGVIVGAIVVSQQQDESSSSSASNVENERPAAGDLDDDGGTMIVLTRTPTTARPTVFTPTAAPSSNGTDPICDNNMTVVDDLKVTFPVSDMASSNDTIIYNDCSWVSSQTVEQLDLLCQTDTAAYELCRLTCRNCNELPMNQKKAWPIELCGGDSADMSFDAGMNEGMGNCMWLSKSPFDIDRLCQPDNDAFNLCRETCRNCGPYVTNPITKTMIPTISPTTAPVMPNITSDTPSGYPSAAPISLTLAPSNMSLPEATLFPSAGPSLSPVAMTLPPVTEAPVTAAPVTPEDALAGIIISASPESADRLVATDSTQSQALGWLRMGLDAGTFGTTVSDARTVQIWTLATFAFSLGLNELWLVSGGNDECLWDGIVCSADTRTVVGIDLESRTITGTLPPELSLLSGLIGLNLSTNNISGKLPKNFGSTFQELEDLRFDRNDITGTLPSTVGMMSALRIWYMERNPAMTGTIPSTVVQLSNLEEFVFYYTDITGVIPQEICDLPNLTELRLDCVKTSFVGDTCWTRCLFLCGGDSGVPCTN